MKGIPILLAVSSFLLLADIAAGAQNLSPPESATTIHRTAGEPTIEELYLKNVAMRIIREQATDLTRSSKLLALESIREMIDNGSLKRDSKTAVDVLDYLANEGTGRVVRSDNRQVNNFPEVRREACNLLGRIGGSEAERVLLQVLFYDKDPMVLSEAAYALGRIGTNRDNAVSHRMADVVIRTTETRPDDSFAFATVVAFQRLATKNHGLNDPTAFRALIAISEGPYSGPVRDKALQVLDELKHYG